MFNETTDVSTVEQMVIHGRYVNGSGEVATRFLKIVDVTSRRPCFITSTPPRPTILPNLWALRLPNFLHSHLYPPSDTTSFLITQTTSFLLSPQSLSEMYHVLINIILILNNKRTLILPTFFEWSLCLWSRSIHILSHNQYIHCTRICKTLQLTA